MVLHGSAANLVRIDCGEFQLEHEVAKLIGATDAEIIFTGGGTEAINTAIRGMLAAL